jgi:membrane-associated protein
MHILSIMENLKIQYNVIVYIIHLLLTYKYIILIPLSIIEGPIVTVICGFLVTLKFFNPLLVYVIMVAGDIVGDGLIYYIGYSGKKFLKYFRVTEERLEAAKKYFAENHKKAIAMSKLVHGIGFTGLVAAGASHVPYKRYFLTCAIISIIQSFVMLMLGIFFGHAYTQIGKYLNYYAAGASVLALIILLIIFLRKYKIGAKTI